MDPIIYLVVIVDSGVVAFVVLIVVQGVGIIIVEREHCRQFFRSTRQGKPVTLVVGGLFQAKTEPIGVGIEVRVAGSHGSVVVNQILRVAGIH